MQTKKSETTTTTEALSTINSFVKYANAHDYQKDLLEVSTYAMSSEWVDCDPLKRGNMMFLMQQLHQLISAVYIIYK